MAREFWRRKKGCTLSRLRNSTYEPHQLGRAVHARAEHRLRRDREHLGLVFEHVAALRVEPGHSEAPEAAFVLHPQAKGTPLGLQLLVPDHLREGDGHGEATPLQPDPRSFELGEGPIEPRVPRTEVVPQGRGDRLVVLLVAPVEPSRDPELELAQVGFQAGEGPRHEAALLPGGGLGHEDVLRPLVAREGFYGEPQLLRFLVDGGLVLGRGGVGERRTEESQREQGLRRPRSHGCRGF